jgi:hypothetical protein
MGNTSGRSVLQYGIHGLLSDVLRYCFSLLMVQLLFSAAARELLTANQRCSRYTI